MKSIGLKLQPLGKFVPPALSRAYRPAPVFQIGFNKCGTTSLSGLFDSCNIPAVHWDHGRAARSMMRRIERDQDPIADYPLHKAFTDLIHIDDERILEPYKRFDYLSKWYPQALFILNTRDRERWIASRLNHKADHVGMPLRTRYARALGLDESAVPDYWRQEWDDHHARARAFFGTSDRFLEYNIEHDDPAVLSAFIGRFYPGCENAELNRLNTTS